MSKTLLKYDYFGESKSHQKALKALGRTVRVIAKLFEVNKASEKTSKEIDEEVINIVFEPGSLPSSHSEELDGLLISDPINHYLLIRMAGTWKKIKAE